MTSLHCIAPGQLLRAPRHVVSLRSSVDLLRDHLVAASLDPSCLNGRDPEELVAALPMPQADISENPFDSTLPRLTESGRVADRCGMEPSPVEAG